MFPCHAVLSRDVSRTRTLATQVSSRPFHCMTKLDAIPFVEVCDFLRGTMGRAVKAHFPRQVPLCHIFGNDTDDRFVTPLGAKNQFSTGTFSA